MQTAARPCVSLETHSVFALGGPTHGAAEVRPTLRRGRLHLVGSSRFSLGGFQLRREAQWQDVDLRRQVPRSPRAQAQDVGVPPQANKRMAPQVRSEEMVDPLVAKQLALVQLEQRRKNANFVKERRKEEVNGALALLGVAAGLAAEANTGKTVCEQVLGALDVTGLSALWQWIVT